MHLRAEIKQTGKTAAGIVVPPEVVAGLGSSRRPPVRVTIGGYTFRTSIAPMGGTFMLGISAETRARAGIQAGEEVDLEIELDTEPREVDVPIDLAAALDLQPAAKQAFERLSYSGKRRLTIAIEAAKADDTRRRRVEKTIAELRGDAGR